MFLMSLKYTFFMAACLVTQDYLQATHFDGTYCTLLTYVNSSRSTRLGEQHT
jgi:hypothetical protein